MRAYERLIRYAKVHTASSEDLSRTPTTERQFDLSRLLAEEMTELGLEGSMRTSTPMSTAFCPRRRAARTSPASA